MRSISSFPSEVSRIEYPFYECRGNDNNLHEFEFLSSYFVRCRHCDGILFLEDYDEYHRRFFDKEDIINLMKDKFKWVI